MDKISSYLQQLDLSEIEAQLYLTLLQTGPSSIRELAEITKMKRTTAYFYIDQLGEKGLAIKLVKGSRKLVAANEPENLENLVEKKLAAAQETKNELNQIFSLIDKKMPEEKKFDKSDIRHYKGRLAMKKLYDDFLTGKELRIYANLSKLEKLLAKSDFILPYDIFERGLEKNKELQIYEIIADEPGTIDQFEVEETSQKDNRYQYKYLPADIGLTSPGIAFYKDKVAIISGTNAPYITIVEDADYYDNSVKLFDFIWNVLPEPSER